MVGAVFKTVERSFGLLVDSTSTGSRQQSRGERLLQWTEYMRAIAWLLRIFCYLFHMILALALIALGLVAVRSNVHDMRIETLPWQGTQLNDLLIILGAAGLLSVLLAVTDHLRFLLPLWAIFVLAILVRGVFFSATVTFSGREDFHNWLLLVGGAGLAAIGSLTLFGQRRTY